MTMLEPKNQAGCPTQHTFSIFCIPPGFGLQSFGFAQFSGHLMMKITYAVLKNKKATWLCSDNQVISVFVSLPSLLPAEKGGI